jgi:hypothetical protein
MVDPWKVKESKRLVREIVTELSTAPCPDCGSGNIKVVFRVSKGHGGLEYHTVCGNCKKQKTY